MLLYLYQCYLYCNCSYKHSSSSTMYCNWSCKHSNCSTMYCYWLFIMLYCYCLIKGPFILSLFNARLRLWKIPINRRSEFSIHSRESRTKMSQWKRALRQRFAGSDCKSSPCLRREGLPATSLVHTWKHVYMETCTRGNMCTWKHVHVETCVHMYGIRVHTVPVFAPIFEQRKPSYGKRQKSVGNLQSGQLSISCIYMYIYYIYMYVCICGIP